MLENGNINFFIQSLLYWAEAYEKVLSMEKA
jgi:hypothetical protein